MALAALLVFLLWLFMLPLFAAGKVVDRQAQVFDAETSATVYDSSRQYQQGINRDLARYCRDWYMTEGSAKLAVAGLIRSTVSTYEGVLTPDNRACLAEVN